MTKTPVSLPLTTKPMTSTTTRQWTPGCGAPHPETLLLQATNKVLSCLLMLLDTGAMTQKEYDKVSTRYLKGMGYENRDAFYEHNANWEEPNS